MTLNNLIELLRKYVQSHKQLNDFGRGNVAELGASKDQKYPLMWVQITASRYSNNTAYYGLQLAFADLIFDDKKNEVEVQSDMLLVGLDTIAYLRENPDFDFNIEGDVTIDFFTERFTDLTAGCVLGLTLKDPKPLDRCEIPLD